MKKLKIKKPNIKNGIQKIKALKWQDVKNGIKKIRMLKWEHIKALYQEHKVRQKERDEAFRNSEFAKKMRARYERMNQFSLLLHAGWAIIINFLIEAMSRHSILATWIYMTETPLVFLYNAFMIFMTFSIVYLFKKRGFMRILISVIWLVIGIVNGVILAKRVTPFNAQDLKTLTEGLSIFSNYFNKLEFAGIILAFLGGIWLIRSFLRITGEYQGKINYIVSVAIVAASFGGYAVLTDLAIEHRVISTYFGNIAFAYQDYGLPYCFAASVFDTGISQPNGYKEKLVAEVSKDGALTKSKADTKELPNVIFVQLESFFDTSEYESLITSKDPLPNFRRLSREYSSGYCQVPSIGAGTANTEFEVVTGMSLRFFGPGEYPYKTYLKEKTAESAATAFGSLGYGTHAIHNHSGNFYSRAKVFDHIGFDTFTSREFMNFEQTPTGWAKDEVLVGHIKDCLDATDKQDFVFTISVQGHGSYPEEEILMKPEISVTGMETEEKNNQWEYYVNQVYEMDQFVDNLIKMVEKRGEPTVVVFYGDHLPTMGLEEKDMRSHSLFNTNYLIWDNIGLQRKGGTIPTYQLMAEVMDRIGVHAGTIFNYHQDRMGSYNYRMDLELLQYDILYGKQYVYGGNPIITEGHMTMGINDAEIFDVTETTEGEYTLIGKNFTKWSQVYINNEKQSRKFINRNIMKLTKSELEDWDVVTIKQVGSRSTIFRTSPEFVYLEGELQPYTDELKAEKELLKVEEIPMTTPAQDIMRTEDQAA